MTTVVSYIIRAGETTPPYVSLYAQTEEVWRRKVLAAINGRADASQVPCGSILIWAGVSAPPGFLICDGSTFAQIDFPALYAIVGVTYGGSATTFLLPDLRGASLVSSTVTPAQTVVGGAVTNATTPAATAVGGVGSGIITDGRPTPIRDNNGDLQQLNFPAQ
jgi:hypothetical protein